MKYLKYITFGLGTAAGFIAYRSIDNVPVATLTLIVIIVVTGIVTTLVEQKTKDK